MYSATDLPDKPTAEFWRSLLLSHDVLHDAADQPLTRVGNPQPPFSSKLLALLVGTLCDAEARAVLVAAIDEELRTRVRDEVHRVLHGEGA